MQRCRMFCIMYPTLYHNRWEMSVSLVTTMPMLQKHPLEQSNLVSRSYRASARILCWLITAVQRQLLMFVWLWSQTVMARMQTPFSLTVRTQIVLKLSDTRFWWTIMDQGSSLSAKIAMSLMMMMMMTDAPNVLTVFNSTMDCRRRYHEKMCWHWINQHFGHSWKEFPLSRRSVLTA